MQQVFKYYKKAITKKSRNSKLKEKYSINKKTHLVTEKFCTSAFLEN